MTQLRHGNRYEVYVEVAYAFKYMFPQVAHILTNCIEVIYFSTMCPPVAKYCSYTSSDFPYAGKLCIVRLVM